METKGLIFIPDISGFTRFVSETEIDHSRMIIQEMLETLINANQMDLQISEIEGDAILFYKFGASPELGEIYKQVERMFCEFHRHLVAYDQRKFCQCQACLAAIQLTLKVITHYGEFTEYNVKTFNKLIGRDIIVAHQLLKNDIDKHEYWLVTKSLLADASPATFTEWMEWNSSTRPVESGEIGFYFTQLSELKKQIDPEPLPQLYLSDKVRALSLSREYQTDIITLFHATGDFNFRNKWQEGVKEVEEVDHLLPRIGMRCRCVMEDGHIDIYSSSYSYSPEKIVFSDTFEKEGHTMLYTLEKKGESITSLTIDFYLQRNIPAQLLFNLFKKGKVENTLQKSMLNLDDLVKELHLPGPI
ncbi:DUF2652 domain-containing protein [Segetibacter sp. 3557_3]|uniref:DUF2652 domain-containing protein n=1 Tax=Segetibacter sp. 3557_3 TaxID=2547429 RepID=UPI0010586B87|nr:DUF2652 domain-containing protein [Segetibacter sp. 3557_3]TDH24253.1 DUF2652 domain-containing protein [Segetibacter sp. 3557_3]